MWISGYSYSSKVQAVMERIRLELNRYIGAPNTEDTRNRIRQGLSRISREFIECIGIDTDIEITALDDHRIHISLKKRGNI
jgi:hypothetical protein